MTGLRKQMAGEVFEKRILRAMVTPSAKPSGIDRLYNKVQHVPAVVMRFIYIDLYHGKMFKAQHRLDRQKPRKSMN